MLEVLNRLPHTEPLQPYVPELLRLSLVVLQVRRLLLARLRVSLV